VEPLEPGGRRGDRIAIEAAAAQPEELDDDATIFVEQTNVAAERSGALPSAVVELGVAP
jgi:hypothetical protein